MARRMMVLAIAVVMSLSIAVPSAFGWSNGPATDAGGVGGGFGTHDWVLDNAIRFAGTGGEWIDADAAMLASDDPDTLNTDRNLHIFRDQGIGRGAPAEIASLYSKAVAAYKAGDITGASKYIGVLSHYYSDISQPFHTDYRALSEETRHYAYERAVDDLTRTSGQSAVWAVPAPAVRLTDVRGRAVSAAYFSRSKYGTLIAALKSSSAVNTGNTKLVTGQVLSRASNDLADIIRAVPAGDGLAKAPAKLNGSHMSVYYPASTGKVCASTTALDAAGKPIEGAVVTFVWPLKAGTKTVKAYTNSAGYAYYWQTLDGLPLMKKATVAIASSAGGTTTSSSTWFMPTPVLGAGAAGITTSMSNHYPKQNTSVTASTLIRNTAGKPVVGLPVTFSWKFKTVTYTYKTVTNSSGVAKSARNIGSATKGYKVYVRAQTQSGGYNRSSTGSFTPK